MAIVTLAYSDTLARKGVTIGQNICTKRYLNAVLFSASPIPIVRVPSQDVIDAEELGDATDGVANGPEDRLDNVLNQVADGLLHGPDEPQDGKVLVFIVTPEAEIWRSRI